MPEITADSMVIQGNIHPHHNPRKSVVGGLLVHYVNAGSAIFQSPLDAVVIIKKKRAYN